MSALSIDARLPAGELLVSVAFELAAGECIAVVGPNGAGKTTLLRAISGLAPLHAGRITAGGVEWDVPDGGVFVPPERRSVGFVFQQYRLFAHLSALDNVAFGLRARGVPAGEARRRARQWLERVGASSVGTRRPAQLSGGESQRVAIARALATDPVVVLLDEPLSAIDAGARATLRRDIADVLVTSAACRVVVTHDPADVVALADRVVVVEHGQVTQSGTLDDLVAMPRTPFVADLLGVNLLRGRHGAEGFVTDDGFVLAVGASHDDQPPAQDGPAIASLPPQAISLHRQRPEGSPRNVWETDVRSVERAVDRVRVGLGPRPAVVAELTPGGWEALGCTLGDRVWASIKASEVRVSAL